MIKGTSGSLIIRQAQLSFTAETMASGGPIQMAAVVGFNAFMIGDLTIPFLSSC